MKTSVSDEVRAILAKMEALGAKVKVGPAIKDADIAGAGKRLGFVLPDEDKEFLREFGRIEIELVRTWFFYGLKEQRKIKKLYEEVFEIYWDDGATSDDTDDEAPYVPRRFVVLADEGDYANVGEGFVWDGDLGHLRATAGDELVEKAEFYEGGYWAFLSDQLERIHGRISDPDDGLVSGSEAEVARRRKLPR